MKKKFVSKVMSDEKAQIWGEFVDRKWGKRGGNPDPHQIVEEAKRKTSPIHDFFDWDIKRAAEKHWLWQARYYMSVVIVVSEKAGPIKAFESVVINEKRVYASQENISRSEDLTEQVVERSLRELNYWILKNKSYRSHFKLFNLIEEFSYENSKTRSKNTANKNTKRHHNNNRGLTASR